MPVQPCRRCAHPAPRWLEASSQDAWVNYYRCEACGFIWHVPKPGYPSPSDFLGQTPPPPPPPEPERK